MKLSEFKSSDFKTEASELNDNQKQDSNKYDENMKENLQNKFNEFSQMSQENLMQELFKEVAKQKNNGTFDYQKLEQTLSILRPTLGEDNYQNMKKILENLR